MNNKDILGTFENEKDLFDWIDAQCAANRYFTPPHANGPVDVDREGCFV